MRRLSYFVGFVLTLTLLQLGAFSQTDSDALPIKKCSDFELRGDGSAPQWQQIDWATIPFRKGSRSTLDTAFKVMYSDSGIYFLFRCQDEKLTATITTDFEDLWHEDVVEVFLWTDEDFPIYFEYELSPLNYELPILIPNLKDKLLGWQPWHYDGARRTRHATSVVGAAKQSGASISAWMAAFFIPFELLTPLGNVPPQSGFRWRANLYRCDYDTGEVETWAWQPIEKRFHEYQKFGTFIFE
jgi:hypothetical protein